MKAKAMAAKRGKEKPSFPASTIGQVSERPRYGIDIAKAWKLRVVNKLSFSEIANTLNCSKSTVHAALERLNKLLPDPEVVEAYESVEPYLLTAAKAELLASLMDAESIEKASLNNRAFAFSQVANHERLTKGLSTNNVSVIEKILDQSHETVYAPKASRTPQAGNDGLQACIDVTPPASASSETEPEGEA
jgi:predicted DNA-binding protein YlxM (UPF0122 family)